MNVTTCKSCPAQVAFVPSETTGRLMCLNAEPDPARGNVVIVDGKARMVRRGDLFEGENAGPFFLSHFVTCPNSASHRKRK